MLVALPEGEKARENVFVYGDVRFSIRSSLSSRRRSFGSISQPWKRAEFLSQVANAGVIQAGHTGWGQACIVVQNVVRSIKASAAGETPSLLEYTKTIPQIKVSLGLVRLFSSPFSFARANHASHAAPLGLPSSPHPRFDRNGRQDVLRRPTGRVLERHLDDVGRGLQ